MAIRGFEDKSPHIARSAYVDPTAEVIGDVTVEEYVSIWPKVVVRGDIHSIHIGARTNIQDGSILHVTHASDFSPQGFSLWIGAEVTVGHQVVLHGCHIEDRCLIGMGAIIMDGARVHSGVIVGAGSLIPPSRELEGGYLWLGSPVKKARALTDKELRYLKYSADHYVRLKDRYLQT